MSNTLASFALALKTAGSYQESGVHANTTSYPLRLALDDDLANGTLKDQANGATSFEYSLSAGASVIFDLAGASLSSGAVALIDPTNGAVLSFAKIKTLIIHNQSEVVGEILTIGATVTNSWKAWNEPLGPDGIFIRHEPSAAGLAVTAGTGDLLKITNAGAAANTFDFLIVGVKA